MRIFRLFEADWAYCMSPSGLVLFQLQEAFDNLVQEAVKVVEVYHTARLASKGEINQLN